MTANRDFVDLLQSFDDHDVELLIVGAHALAAHGHVRATKALDVFIRATPENAGRAMRALAAFGAPLDDLTAEDLATDFKTWPTSNAWSPPTTDLVGGPPGRPIAGNVARRCRVHTR